MALIFLSVLEWYLHGVKKKKKKKMLEPKLVSLLRVCNSNFTLNINAPTYGSPPGQNFVVLFVILKKVVLTF